MKNVISVAIMCLLISACGFEPIYGNKQQSNQVSIKQNLEHINIENIPDRSGQILRNALIDRFYTNGRPSNIIYSLNITPIKENVVDLDITKNSDATRSQLRLKTIMKLIDINNGEVVLSRNLSAISSYNVLTSEFATRVSAQNTRENAINDLARQIELQIDLYFNR